ncbi:hypothetical protein CDD83_9392 [Cordyceps sp. RAO-2017]|nr:hypothetical protein CDD83_9392 [Cordyceps sp. RAO-2017]
MKCMGHSWPEECLGTKGFCRRRKNEKQCLEQRERPVYWQGLESECRSMGRYGEPCIGTLQWCERGVAIEAWRAAGDDGDLEAINRCIAYRAPRPQPEDDWQQGSFSTEAICLPIERDETRTGCYRAHAPIPFQLPFDRGCPTFGSDQRTDERCLGSVAWCERLGASYGSASACLSVRTARPATKLPWSPGHGGGCAGPASEACLGTEALCVLAVDEVQRRECFASRQRPPLRPVAQEQCPEERCAGTLSWCAYRWQETGYSSETECFGVRGVAPVAFMAAVADGVARGTEQVLVKAALGRANATMVAEAVKNETQDSRVWMDRGIKAGRELFDLIGRDNYLRRGIETGVGLAFRKQD